MIETTNADPAAPRYAEAEKLIARLTLLIGGAAAILVAFLVSPKAGIGVFIGAALAWVNFRWLGHALDAMVRVASASPGTRVKIPFWTYAKYVARYGLIALVLYAMVTRFGVPVVSMIGGLCALGAATIAEGLYEAVFRAE